MEAYLVRVFVPANGVSAGFKGIVRHIASATEVVFDDPEALLGFLRQTPPPFRLGPDRERGR